MYFGKVDNFIWNHGEKLIAGFVVLVIGLVVWLVMLDNDQWKQCEAEGGRKVQVGTETGWRTQMVGKIAVTQPYTYAVYACQK